MSHPIAGASLAHTASAPTWHRLSADEAVKFLGINSLAGLELREARTRARSHGPNRLAEKPPRSPWILFLGQFKSPLILAAALATGIGKIMDAAVILSVVLLNAALGFYQEYRAEQSLAALKKMLPSKARVRRGGNT